MGSTLKRLFTFAKSEQEALENFTTEALAAGIRLDPHPFLTAMRASGIPLPEGSTSVYDVLTQVGVTGVGILDLVLAVRGSRSERLFWFEVKCHAGESGDQLARYHAHLAALPSTVRPHLVVLARAPLAGHADLPWLSWQALWRASAPSQTSMPAWWDVRTFLEETGMANRYEAPITAHEASAQTDAYALLRKMALVLEPVVAHAASVAPELSWPSGKKIHAMLAKHFGGWGAFTVGSRGGLRAGVAFGAYLDEETRESWAGVRVWQFERDLALRKELVAGAEARSLPSAWTRAPADEPGGALVVYARLASFDSLASLSDWFVARLNELQAASLFAAVRASGARGGSAPNGDEDELDAEDGS